MKDEHKKIRVSCILFCTELPQPCTPSVHGFTGTYSNGRFSQVSPSPLSTSENHHINEKWGGEIFYSNFSSHASSFLRIKLIPRIHQISQKATWLSRTYTQKTSQLIKPLFRDGEGLELPFYLKLRKLLLSFRGISRKHKSHKSEQRRKSPLGATIAPADATGIGISILYFSACELHGGTLDFSL